MIATHGFDPMGSISPIIISYCDLEEQFIIWKLMSDKAFAGVTAERALLYCAVNGWTAGVCHLIRTGVDREYLRVARSAARLFDKDAEFKAALADTKVNVVDRKCPRDRCKSWVRSWEMSSGKCRHPCEPAIPSCADDGDTFLVGSALAGWETGIDLAINAKKENPAFVVVANAFYHAAGKGYADTMQKLAEHMWIGDDDDMGSCVNYSLTIAAHGGHKSAMQKAMEFGADNIEGVLVSCAFKDIATGIIAAVELGAERVDDALKAAAKWNNRKAAAAAIKMGAVNYKSAAAKALGGGHIELADFILSHKV